MEKKLKNAKGLVFILLAVLLAVLAFGGIYIKNYGIWENMIPEFKTGMELNGFREVRFVLDNSEEEKNVYVDDQGNIVGEVPPEEMMEEKVTEGTVVATEENKEQPKEEPKKENLPFKTELRKIKANSDEVVNIENFNKTKEIIQKRLEELDSYEYNIRMDNVTGEIILELPDDPSLETQTQLVLQSGKIEVVDAKTGVVLLNNSNLKTAKILAGPVGQNSALNSLFLQLEFDKEGKQRISDISKTYVTVTDETGKQEAKEITIKLDGMDLVTTSFGQPIENGILSIGVGQPTNDNRQLMEAATQLRPVEIVLTNGPLPLVYKMSADNFIDSTISDNTVLVCNVLFAVAILAVSIYLIVKYKAKGAKAAIYSIGYIATLILVLKYTQVTLTLNSVIALLLVIVVNYGFNIRLLNKIKKGNEPKEVFGDTIKEVFLSIVPLCIIAFIFTFMSSVVISTIGMVLFWGLIILALYNLITVYALDLM